MRVLTDAQRRERQRARLDAQAGDSRKLLDVFVNPEKEETFGYGLNFEGEPLPEDLDDLHDPLADDDAYKCRTQSRLGGRIAMGYIIWDRVDRKPVGASQPQWCR